MNLDACAGRVTVFFAKGIFEDAFDAVCGRLVSVNRKISLPAKAEGAQIVETHDMIGVAVSVEDGIDAANVFAQGLCVKVRSGIDQHNVIVVGKADGRTRAPVMWIAIGRDGGGAYGAVAAESRHTH